MILVNGTRWCTGSLINTTANDNRPYFLTANHCLDGFDAEINNSPNLTWWSFYWHYEAPTCTNAVPTIRSTVGATLVANNPISDFALLYLSGYNSDPRYRSDVTPYYLGWDRSGNAGTGGVGIHHPVGDLKKISTHNITPPTNSNCMNFDYNGVRLANSSFWMINWKATQNGYSVTEGGSSGSPLLNNNGRVIGQLFGAGACPNPNCSNPSADIANYGKFSVSWTCNGASDIRKRLNYWLDPLGTNPSTLNGMGVIIPCTTETETFPTVTYVNQGSTSRQTPSYVAGVTNYRWEAYPSGAVSSFTDIKTYQQVTYGMSVDAHFSFSASGLIYIYGYAVMSCGEATEPSYWRVYYVDGRSPSSSGITVYPNPVNDILTVEIDASVSQGAARSSSPDYDLRLYDRQGNLVQQQKTKGGTVLLHVSNLPNGLYYLHVYDGVNSNPEVFPILVKH